MQPFKSLYCGFSAIQRPVEGLTVCHDLPGLNPAALRLYLRLKKNTERHANIEFVL
jgi:hypothetical protein